jgi:hypothetical protein
MEMLMTIAADEERTPNEDHIRANVFFLARRLLRDVKPQLENLVPLAEAQKLVWLAIAETAREYAEEIVIN